MKKLLFTFVMMIALVIVAGSAMGQGKFAPYPGGKYSYKIPIDIANQSDATLSATIASGIATISNIVPALENIPATTTEISFDIEFSNTATGTCKIEFSITDEVGCTNNTFYEVTMAELPTYTLTIARNITGYEECQKRTGVSQDSPDALGNGTEKNTFSFTVTPSFTGLTATYDFDYEIALKGGTGVLDEFNNGTGSVTGYAAGVVSRDETNAADPHVYTITFNTTTGITTEAIIATLNLANSQLTLPVEFGGGIYTATMADPGAITQTVNAKAVPTIGKFK